MSAAALLALVLLADPAPSPSPAAVVLDRRALQELPHGADLGSLLREAPGVIPDRTAVGGSDVGLQAVLVSKGDPGTGATFLLDGVDVTDVAAPGSSSLQFDVDALETLTLQSFGADVSTRAAGVRVEATLRAPSAGRHGAMHVRLTPDALQSDNLPEALRERPLPRSRTRHVVEGGGELSGWLMGGRLWLFGAASRDAIAQDTFTGHGERLRSDSFLGRARFLAAAWDVRLLLARTEKQHDDRDPVLSAAPEARWRQSGPTQVVALEMARSLGPHRQARLRGSWLDSVFRLDAQGGVDADVQEDLRGLTQGSYVSSHSERPRATADVTLEGREDTWPGSHTWLLGTGFERRRTRSRSAWPGNGVLALERQSVFFRTFELSGFALPVRDQDAHGRVDALHAFAQDEVRRGPWTLRAGVRLERVAGQSREATVSANAEFPDLLPAVSSPGGGTGISWTDVLPRALVRFEPDAWRMEAGWGRYAAPLSTLDATFDAPLAREASLVYYWRDLDGDRSVDRGELDESYGRVGANNVDPENPSADASPQRISPSLRAPLTHETHVAVGRRLGATSRVDVTGGWRRMRHLLWRPVRDLTTADYVARGAVRGELFDDTYAVVYFSPSSAARLTPGHGRVLSNRAGYRQDVLWADLTAAGSSSRLDWRAWVSFTDWRESFEDRGLAVQDPTPVDTEPLQGAGPVAVRPGGLGRGDVFVNSRWSVGLSGAVSLPLALRLSTRVWAREGFPVPYVHPANSGDPTAGTKLVLVSPSLTAYRLPAVLLVDLGVRRSVAVGSGHLGLGLDAFNVLNLATRLQGERDVELPGFDRPRELLRPRTLRVGLDYRF